MSMINNFKLLNEKCSKYFNLISLEQEIYKKDLSPKQKQRHGFYIYMLENLCDIKDIGDILSHITDTEFNREIFGKADTDHGIDAVYVDEEEFTISFFNFKFREKFNIDQEQNLNETIISSKFFNSILSEDLTGLKGKLKSIAKNVIEKVNSDHSWDLKFFVVSNEMKELRSTHPDLKRFSDIYGLEVIPIGLPYINELMSIRPEKINSQIILNNDAIMSYSENEMASSKSYIIRLSLPDLIRITVDDSTMRLNSGLEDLNELNTLNMNYEVLFDNVRGYVKKSKFNDNIALTLEKNPEKFFMFNNGITITSSSIKTTPINAGKKFKINIKDFQVVNGGQTLRTIHEFMKRSEENIEKYISKAEILIRMFSIDRDDNEDDSVNKIAEYTNSQNSISVIDLKSLRSEQIQLEQYLSTNGIIYSRKSGDIGSFNDTGNYIG